MVTQADEMGARGKSKLNDVRKIVSANADAYVARLADAVAVRSVSTDLELRGECVAMAELLHEWIEKLGGTSEKVLVGFQELDDGTRFDLPPVVLGQFGEDPKKPTVLVYGHYDVQPADAADGWNTDPWVLTEVDGNMFGRGSTDDKGPVLAWLWAVEVHRELGLELPVNLKLCFEGMEESDSECLADLIGREATRGGFLSDIDYAIISDNYWLGTTKPALCYGLRGIASFQVAVSAGSKTLHSGIFGGVIAEPMTDVVQLLAAVTAAGHGGDIPVPGCARSDCTPLSLEEEALYRGISFDVEEFRKEAGDVPSLIGGTDATSVLMNRWRYPALSVHGIEGGYSGTGMKTVIPGSATGKFSVRLVPGQDPKAVEEAMRGALEARFAELNSPNQLSITSSSSDPWLADPKGPLYQAGASALLKVYGVRPDLTREGGSIPITNMLQDALGVETMLLPLGQSDDGAHGENEKMARKNYLHGISVLATVMDEVARVHAEGIANGTVTRKRAGALGRLRDIWYGLS